ncbi:MAG: aldehyde dehydrogenase family protein [Nostocoides sp.]
MSPAPRRPPAPSSAERVPVRKTYKLYLGGAFPRSESGRSYAVYAAGSPGRRPRLIANAAQGSRKDVRNAVTAAKAAANGWAGATAYNRGQVLYRVAEVMEGRRDQLAQAVADAEGGTAAAAQDAVSAAIDRWVWWAGWSDKYAQVLGGLNPVAGPYFDISAPEPSGVIGVLAPQASSLLGLVSVIAPVVVSGNTCVVLASTDRPAPAIDLAECLATSDVPAGVVNILTGSTAEMAPWLASHQDVAGLDLTGAAGAQDVDWADLEVAAADTVKRVLIPAGTDAAAIEEDFRPTPGLTRLTAFLETKTVWHPKGT